MTREGELPADKQRILVFQENGSGERKIEGIRRYGEGLFILEIFSLDTSLPPIVDDTRRYLPSRIQADVVLDFLIHPDLSHDLAVLCREGRIPVVASGKKFRVKGAFTPPT